MPVRQYPAKRRLSGGLYSAALTAILMSWASPAATHHYFAPLLTESGDEVIGVYGARIDVFKLANPHSVLIVNVENDDGTREDWLIELSSASILIREGWTDDLLAGGDEVTIAIQESRSPNRGRLGAILLPGRSSEDPARLLTVYVPRGNTPVMRRLRDRLPACGTIVSRFERSECFVVDAEALRELQEEFPGKMAYVLP